MNIQLLAKSLPSSYVKPDSCDCVCIQTFSFDSYYAVFENHKTAYLLWFQCHIGSNAICIVCYRVVVGHGRGWLSFCWQTVAQRLNFIFQIFSVKLQIQ